MPNINLKSDSLVESLLKRKGGTKVTLGHKITAQRKYDFQPLDVTDPESPHICDVQDEDDYAHFLSIREGFRRYRVGKTNAVDSIPANQTKINEDDFKNQFDDLLSVDADGVSNEWLQQFSNVVLEISPKAKAKLSDYLKQTYGKELEGVPAANTIIREILKARIAEEKTADEQLKLGGAGQNEDVDAHDGDDDPQDDE